MSNESLLSPNSSSPPAANQPPASPPPTEPPAPGTPPSRKSRKKLWGIAAAVVVLAALIPVWRQATCTPGTTVAVAALAEPQTVPVARVTREDLFNELHYYAEFRPYAEVELHAKVAGYVQSITVDFGDKVKAGQLLATLEVPELKDELDAALAAQQKAEADYKDAHLTYGRLMAVEKEHANLVAQQDLDNAESKDLMTKAAIAAAKAEVEKYQTLAAYTRITAPFDGVVTHRYADVGSLIQAGTASDTQSMPVVRVSDNYHLRLDFPVSVAYVKDIHPGDTVDVKVGSLDEKTFTGKITRATERVNEDTRKMTAEVEVPNPNLELVPGMYATVTLKADKHPQALSIPIEAVPPGNTSTVYVVNSNNEIEERQVTFGIDTPTKFEVLAGLKEGERVLLGSRSRVKLGQKVEPKFRDETLAKD